jgi:hypothetical protein
VTYLQLLELALKYAPVLKEIANAAPKDAGLFGKIEAVAQPLSRVIEEIGILLFPTAQREIRIIAAALAVYDQNTTVWLQKALNRHLNLPQPLLIDGHYGPMTRAALELALTRLGCVRHSWVYSTALSAIELLVSQKQ